MSARWTGVNEHLRHSKANVAAWFLGESLVSLDVEGRATKWSYEDRRWQRTELFDLNEGKSTSPVPIALWPSGDGWLACVRFQSPLLWSPSRAPLVPGLTAICMVRAGDRIFLNSNEERFLLMEWTPGQEAEVVANLKPLVPTDDLRSMNREYVEGLAVLRQDPPQLMIWSQKRLFLWDEAEGIRPFEDRSGIPEHRGLNRCFVVAPGGRRFVLGARGNQIYVGDLENKASWEPLPVPRSYEGKEFFSTVALAFAGEDRLYALTELRGGGARVLSWDLSEQPAVLTHYAVDEGQVPISLTRHPAGLLAIGLQGGRIWLLGRDRLGPYTGPVETAGQLETAEPPK